MADWRNEYIHIDTDGGGARMDIRYDSGSFDFSINGVNEFTMAKEDALTLIKALTEEIVKEEDKCPYCGAEGNLHVYEEYDSDGYDTEGAYSDKGWCSCRNCGKYFLKEMRFIEFNVKNEKEEDVLGSDGE